MPEKGKAKSAKDEKVDRQRLGARLREAREYLGLSQDEVAKYLSIPRTALSHIESGQRGVDALELKKMAQLYKQPVVYFTEKANRPQVCPKTSPPCPRRSRPVGRRPPGIEPFCRIPPARARVRVLDD